MHTSNAARNMLFMVQGSFRYKENQAWVETNSRGMLVADTGPGQGRGRGFWRFALQAFPISSALRRCFIYRALIGAGPKL